MIYCPLNRQRNFPPHFQACGAVQKCGEKAFKASTTLFKCIPLVGPFGQNNTFMSKHDTREEEKKTV